MTNKERDEQKKIQCDKKKNSLKTDKHIYIQKNGQTVKQLKINYDTKDIFTNMFIAELRSLKPDPTW